MSALGDGADPASLEALMGEIDADGSGEVDFTEFVALFNAEEVAFRSLWAPVDRCEPPRGYGTLRLSPHPVWQPLSA